MPRSYVDNLDFRKEIIEQYRKPTLVKDRGQYGWIMYTALVMRVKSNIVRITDGDLITVDIMKMPVLFVSLMVSLSHDIQMGQLLSFLELETYFNKVDGRCH